MHGETMKHYRLFHHMLLSTTVKMNDNMLFGTL